MSTTHDSTLPGTADGMAEFDAITSKWGPITMVLGLIASLAGPLYLLFGDFGITTGEVLVAYLAVAAVIGLFWVLEPLTYFPILGPAAMYQAFMIGNISNKLLPAALVAQSTLDVKPGTRKGDLAAVLAICGAAAVHLTSLLVFVGFFGAAILAATPPEMLQVVQVYVLPALIAAVLVQAIFTVRQPRTAVIAIIVSLAIGLLLVPAWGDAIFFAVPLAVFFTIALAWFLRSRTDATAPATAD